MFECDFYEMRFENLPVSKHELGLACGLLNSVLENFFPVIVNEFQYIPFLENLLCALVKPEEHLLDSIASFGKLGQYLLIYMI